MPACKYTIIGDCVFASITEAPSHAKVDVKWESHRNYIDLQYIITGKAIIGVADASKAMVTKPYSPDVINYTAEGRYYTTDPGSFFLFFPNDAHRPTIKAEGYDIVKKIVIKIKSGEQINPHPGVVSWESWPLHPWVSPFRMQQEISSRPMARNR